MDTAAPSEELAELARRHGVATDYWDWQGQHVVVSVASIRTVLAALGVDASDEEAVLASLAAHDDLPWRRTLPATVVCREGWTPWVAVHVPHGTGVRVDIELEDGTVRAAAQVDHWVPPRLIDDREVGEATFELPGDLPLGWHRLRAHVDGATQDDPTATAYLVVTPGRLELPPALRDGRVWGLMDQVYQVRSVRSWGIGDLSDLAELAAWAGERPGRRLRARQPAARRRTGAADGRLAVPADDPAVRQPGLPAGGEGAGLLRRRRRGAPAGRRAGRRRLGAERRRHHRPRRRVGREAGRPVGGVHGGRARRGVPAVLCRGGRRPGRLRHLVRAGRAARPAVDDVAGRAPGSRLERGGGVPGGARRGRRVPPVAPVAAGPAAGRRTARRAGRGDEAGGRARPRGRRTPRRRGRVGAGRRAGPRGLRRGAAGPVQPAGPELEPAAVATRPARRARLHAVPGHAAHRPQGLRRDPDRPRHRAVPAVVDPGGDGRARGHLRALRPRGAGRDPGPGGAPGRRRRGRRGPRRRGADRPRLHARAGRPRHVDPVVRVGRVGGR